MRWWSLIVGIGGLILVLGACGEDADEVSAVTFPEVRAAVDQGPSGLDPIKGETVRWSGRVVEALSQRGDDYVEEGVVLVDMDSEGQRPEPDVIFNVAPSKLESLESGKPVAFVAVIREMTRGTAGEPLLRVELKKLETP